MELIITFTGTDRDNKFILPFAGEPFDWLRIRLHTDGAGRGPRGSHCRAT